MSSRLTNHEPIPGYRLIERLGRGGYGEVWKAEAPGGLLKAIKFVYGDLEGSSGEGKPAEQELKSLHRVKTIRHPYILSLERFEVIDGQLVIVMELADRNLWDRFNECRSRELPGVPRDELLGYMEETAEALDLMNFHYQIQHLDIKPQNLFLVHSHIKIADFGLAKDFEGMRATVTGGVTPVYAAPETFEGWVSRYCDQYSMAIVYQELLSGVRPFNGTSTRQLLMQHISADPDLTSLPPSDRDAVRRALAKKPDDRFPNCVEMVKALRAAGASRLAPAGSAAGTLRPGSVGGRLDLIPTSLPPPFRSPSRSSGTLQRPAMFRGLPPLITPSGVQQTPATPDRNAVTPAAPVTLQRPEALQTGQLPQLGIAPPERNGPGVLMPALIIGVGGAGLGVMQRARSLVQERFGGIAALPHLRWLFIDTDPETIEQALVAPEPEALGAGEVFAARLQRPAHYLKREDLPPIEHWLRGEVLYRMPRTPSTLGIRALGRLAFVDHYRHLTQRVRSELEVFLSEEPLAMADRATGLGFRSNRPRIYLIASLAGGTGSGMLIDLAYTVRRELKLLGIAQPHVAGMLLLPAVERQTSRPLAVANAFAALQEIHHFSQKGVRYEARLSTREPPLIDPERPFARCAMLSLPRTAEPRETRRAAELAAGHIVQELLSPMGRVVDEARATYLESAHPEGIPLQTFGLYRMSWPRQRLLDQAMDRFRVRVLRAWLGREVVTPPQPAGAWVEEQLHRRRIEPTEIESQLAEIAAKEIGGAPEVVYGKYFGALGRPGRTARLEARAACKVLQRLIKVVGRADVEEAAFPGTLDIALQESAQEIAADFERQLSDLAVHFLEQPGMRFRAADEAVQNLTNIIRQTMIGLEEQYKVLEREIRTDYHRLVPLIGALELSKSAFNLWSGRRTLTTELIELLRTYPGKRHVLLIRRAALAIYRTLLNNAPEYLRQVNACRAKIQGLVERFTNEIRSRPPKESTCDRSILPAGCQNVEEAADRFVASLTAEEVLQFEERLQLRIRGQFNSLEDICVHWGEQSNRFTELFAEEARAFLDPRLESASPTEVFFLHRPDGQAAQREILRAFDESVPEQAGGRQNTRSEVFVLAVPFDAHGERFRQLTREVLPEENLIAAQGINEIVFYREKRHVPLTQVPQAGRVAEEAVEQIEESKQTSPHSRSDISWQPLPRE
jgi:eukaryotic-like serine/threonine-protein kinase